MARPQRPAPRPGPLRGGLIASGIEPYRPSILMRIARWLAGVSGDPGPGVEVVFPGLKHLDDIEAEIDAQLEACEHIDQRLRDQGWRYMSGSYVQPSVMHFHKDRISLRVTVDAVQVPRDQ